jgi:hypothetical protein
MYITEKEIQTPGDLLTDQPGHAVQSNLYSRDREREGENWGRGRDKVRERGKGRGVGENIYPCKQSKNLLCNLLLLLLPLLLETPPLPRCLGGLLPGPLRLVSLLLVDFGFALCAWGALSLADHHFLSLFFDTLEVSDGAGDEADLLAVCGGCASCRCRVCGPAARGGCRG